MTIIEAVRRDLRHNEKAATQLLMYAAENGYDLLTEYADNLQIVADYSVHTDEKAHFENCEVLKDKSGNKYYMYFPFIISIEELTNKIS